MPTFDGGHCFLTTLIPIDSDDVVDQGGLRSSHVQLVRNALSVLPTAHQSPDTEQAPCNSPFARCTKTHFARIAVLDDVIFNGRMPENSLAVAIKGEDPAVPEPVDSLPGPYLLFTADFDAPGAGQAELREWLGGVWSKMRADLDPVFQHCFQYTAKVTDADSFADYVIAHQLDTTMPFNDYWPGPPPLPTVTKSQIVGIGAGVTLVTAGLLYWILSLLHWAAPLWSLVFFAQILLLFVIGLVPALYALYRFITNRGLKPFPVAPNSDLLSVLKGLYLQRQLIPLVASLQGASQQELFDKMGAFLDAVKPDNLSRPTQEPGTIKAVRS